MTATLSVLQGKLHSREPSDWRTVELLQGVVWISKSEWPSDLPIADQHPRTDSIKREGNKFKLVSVSGNSSGG